VHIMWGCMGIVPEDGGDRERWGEDRNSRDEP